MWKKFKKSIKKRWEEVTADQLYAAGNFDLTLSEKLYAGAISLIVMCGILAAVTLFSQNVWLMVIGMCCLVSGLILLKLKVLTERQEKEGQKNKQIEQIKNIFDGRKKIEVKLSKKNKYPYYTEKFYNGLGDLIFLHMLVFVQEALQESSELKIYAELCEDNDIDIYIYANKEKKEYAEFPYELFIKYFEPLKD